MATVHREPNQVKWIGVRPGHNGEQYLFLIDHNAAGVLDTVPADKILLLYDWYISLVDVAAKACQVYMRDDAAANIGFLANLGTCAGTNTSHIAQSLTIPIELPEDYDFYINVGAPARGYIHGILIDA